MWEGLVWEEQSDPIKIHSNDGYQELQRWAHKEKAEGSGKPDSTYSLETKLILCCQIVEVELSPWVLYFGLLSES